MKALFWSALCGLFLIFSFTQLNSQVQARLQNGQEIFKGDNHFLRWHEHVDEMRPLVYNTEKHSALSSRTVLAPVDTSSGCPTEWTPRLRLSPNHGVGPSIATQGENFVHITWKNDFKRRLHYARSTDGGETFTIHDLTDTVMFPEGIAHGKVVANEKCVYIFFIAMLHRDGASPVYMIRSTNNGETFDSPRNTTKKHIIGSGDFFTPTINGDTIAFIPGMNRRMFYSTDGGNNWRMRRLGFQKLYYTPTLTPRTLLVRFVPFTRKIPWGEVYYRLSTNLGRRWTRPQLVSTLDGYSSAGQTGLSAARTGETYIAWRDGRLGSVSGGWGLSVVYRKSTDYGFNWGPEVVVTTIPEAFTSLHPISVEYTTGNPVAAAWNTFRAESENRFVIKARTSIDQGTTWCPEVDLTPESDYAWVPAISVTPTRVIVVWEEESWINSVDFDIFVRSAPLQVKPVPPPSAGNVVNAQPSEPPAVELEQNYPNPFNPSTTIHYEIAEPGFVTIKVYDVLGREVAVLLNNEYKEEGDYELEFDGSAYPSGIYYYRLTVTNEERTITKFMKMNLIK